MLSLAPSKPTSLTIASISPYIILVMWREPNPANGVIRGYKLTYTDTLYGSGARIEVDLAGNVTQYNASRLKPYRIYEFVLQAKTEEPVGHPLWGPQSTPARSRTLPASKYICTS